MVAEIGGSIPSVGTKDNQETRMKTHLPIVGSTAKFTSFCNAVLAGPGGLELVFDGNGKITASNGTLHAPQPNAFSLPAASLSGLEHCPQSTPTCRAACYVNGLADAQTELYQAYERNGIAIREILADDLLANEWTMHVATWITMNASGGFRWHVSGDVFSLAYAQWIADICRESPTVRHWIYTRTFDHLAPLAEVSTTRGGNLSINLSCDADNYAAARHASAEHGNSTTGKPLRLAYLTVDGLVPDDLRTDDVIFPDYKLRPRAVASLQDSEFWQALAPHERGLVCPVDAHGKSEKIRCGTSNCDRCLK